MLSNTELLLVQLNNKMDRLIELLERSLPYEPQNDLYLISSTCSAPLIKNNNSERGSDAGDDTNERG